MEDGGKIRSCKLAYATFGQLTSQKDNAIPILTWYSGTSKIIEQAYIGPGRAIDPDKYYIIIANQIGNGLSSSPHNTSAPFNGIKFPHVRINDDVRAQHRLITEKFGIERLELVMGVSMGAPQTYEWTVRYPEIVKRAAPIAGTRHGTMPAAALVQIFMSKSQGSFSKRFALSNKYLYYINYDIHGIRVLPGKSSIFIWSTVGRAGHHFHPDGAFPGGPSESDNR